MTIIQALDTVLSELNEITVHGKSDIQHMLTAMNLITVIKDAITSNTRSSADSTNIVNSVKESTTVE